METTRTDVKLEDTWAYGAGILHGGWLLEQLAGAALERTAQPHPLVVSAHYLAVPRIGAATIVVEPLREGRSVANLRARFEQEGKPKVEAIISTGTLPPGGAPAILLDGAPPVLPPVEECLENQGAPGFRNGITEQLEVRLDPATAGFLSGAPTGSAEVRGWIRSRDGREPDPLLLLTIADALPPVTFEMGVEGWAPTIELTVMLRALPAPGWLRCVQRARLVQGGWLDEECEIWDSAGHLVAQARQLAAYKVPA